jgi:hypothetical protein
MVRRRFQYVRWMLLYRILNWLSWFTIPGAGYKVRFVAEDGVSAWEEQPNLRGLIQDEIRWFGYTMIGRI